MRTPGTPAPSTSSVTHTANVLVIGADAPSMGQIRETLGTEAALSNTATPFDDAMMVARKNRPNVVIASFDTEHEEAIRIAQQIRAELPKAVLVAIARRTDPDRMRAAMRAGYSEFIVLPEDSELLRQAVHEAVFNDTPDDDAGQVITVWGAKGGVGSTFLSVNLAAEVSPVQRICVLDMDFSMGDVAAMLDLEPASSMADVFKNLNRLDERMLNGQMAIHTSRVHVLAQPKALEHREEPSSDAVMKLLTTVAKSYQYVVLDCGSRVDDAALTAATVADRLLLVTTPDVLSVKNAWRRLQLLDQLGIERSRVSLILNRVDRKNPLLSVPDIEQNLGCRVEAQISEDRVAMKAVNDGKLVRDVDRRSQVARDLEAFTGLITNGEVLHDKKASNSIFASIFKLGG
jgi:pilus assembly protein CpaE